MYRIWSHIMRCRLFLVLLIWVVVGGLAWVDLLDLQDDMAWPLVELQQALESDADEFRGSGVMAAPASDVFLSLPAIRLLASRFPGAASSEALQSRARPLQDTLSVYRI